MPELPQEVGAAPPLAPFALLGRGAFRGFALLVGTQILVRLAPLHAAHLAAHTAREVGLLLAAGLLLGSHGIEFVIEHG